MLGPVFLVQLVLLVSAAQAFFPYFPCYRDENQDTCPPQETTTKPKPKTTPKSKTTPTLTSSARWKVPTGKVGAWKDHVKGHTGDGHGNHARDAAAVSDGSEGIRFKLSRSGPKVSLRRAVCSGSDLANNLLKGDVSSSEHVARAASRLRRKYASKTVGDDAAVKRATNQYSIVTAATPTATNSVGLDQDGTDFSYFIEVAFGSDQKVLYMLLDTGAGTTWVMGSSCASAACALHNSFGAADSKTFVSSQKTFSIAYGSGSVSGTLATDTVNLAGIDINLLFGVANVTSDDFTHFPFDGILGLSMSTGATQNFAQALQGSKKLASNLFSVALNRNSDGTNMGEVAFGSTNPAQFVGAITYTSIAKTGGDWVIPLEDMSYDGKKAGITGRNAYIDTGTSYVFGPATDVAALHKQIPGATSQDGVTYMVPCGSTVPVKASFSGVAYSISPRDWLGPQQGGSGMCTSNIYGHEVVPNSWLLGDLFLKNVYAVFDMDKARIGLAARPTPTPDPAASTASSGSTPPANTAAAGGGGGASPPTTAVTTAGPPGTTSSPSSPPLGLSGHETSATAGSPAAQTATTSANTPASGSPGELLQGNARYVVLCVAAVVAIIA